MGKPLLAPALVLGLAVLVAITGDVRAFHGRDICKDGRLVPTDEAGQDPSLVQFRAQLGQALLFRDKNFLRANVDRKVAVSYDGDTGPDALVKTLEANPGLWETYLEILAGGGFFERKPGKPVRYYAPFLRHAADCMGDSYSLSELNYVFGDKVNLRAKPSTSARVVGVLSYNLVDELDCDKDCRWFKVKTLDGRTGWVRKDFLAATSTPSLLLKKKGRRWVIEYLLPADD